MDMGLLEIILASSLIATIVSSIISAIISIKLKSLDYKNEYYKIILEKRLEAYKFLETQIAVLKGSVVDDDGQVYHLIFHEGEDKFNEFQMNLFLAFSFGMWINASTMKRMEELNELFLKISRKIEGLSEEDIQKTGTSFYGEIVRLRSNLENSIREDLLNLHNLKSFKKNKAKPKKESQIIQID